MTNIATVDVEDWFHLLDHKSTENITSWCSFEKRIEIGLNKILDLFSKYNTLGTFFVLGWVADKYPDLIKEIHLKGHDIANHSYAHKLVYTMTPDEFKKDLISAENAIFNAIGKKPKYYRAPGFSIRSNSKFALKILIETGYDVDCSIFPARRAHGGMKTFPISEPCRLVNDTGKEIIEMPINTAKTFGIDYVFSGGGYFRLFPKPLLTKLYYKSKYNMTYLHPRDLDPEQPMINDLTTLRKFKSYYNLSSTEEKLDNILRNFHLMPISEYLSKQNHQNLPIVELDAF
jgi:peptidoglycan-N-acetylglucosamine deacetylase